MGWVLVFLLLFSFFFLFMTLAPFLLQWNIRSLRANGHWFRSTPAQKARVICLQETSLLLRMMFLSVDSKIIGALEVSRVKKFISNAIL